MTGLVTARWAGTGERMRRGLMAGLLAACAFAGAAEAAAASPEAVLAKAARQVRAGEPAAAMATLEGLEGGKAPAAVKGRADLLLGILLLRQGRPEDAVPRLERAAKAYPLLADYALWNLAAAYRTLGRPAEVAATLRRLDEKHPESLFIERARRGLPRDWLEAGDLTRAEEAAGRYLAAFPRGPGRAEVWTTLGEVLLRSGRAEKAEEVLRRVWVELPESVESRRARDLLATIPAARPFTADELFERAATLYRLGRYGQAAAELAAFAVPGSPREAQARLLLGIGAFRLRQYAQAVQWLEPLRDGAGLDRAEALFWLARSYGRSGDSARLQETMTLLADIAPSSRRAEEGLYLLAQAAADNGDPAQARGYLSRLLKEYPRSVWADKALWLQGWLAYKEQDLDGAVALWDRLLTEERGSPLRASALYWRARALEAMGKPRAAAEVYRKLLASAPDQSYYWFRARRRLARLSKGAVPSPPAAGPAGRKAVRSDSLRARRARALQSLGLDGEAIEEWSDQVRAHPEDRGTLAAACQAFLELERYDKAVWLAGQILRPLYVQENGKPPIGGFWQCLYPRGHWSLVREQAAREGLDPFLVTALIREESAFLPTAVSHAGARGLMQLMPQTAERVARERKLALPSAPLESPEANIRLGTIHLADLIRDNGGSLSLALAGYNAGQVQVRRWRDRYGFTDEEQFTEDIPYAETRNYVKRVLGSFERYASLYGARRAEDREPRADSAPLRRAERGKRAPGAKRREGKAQGRQEKAGGR